MLEEYFYIKCNLGELFYVLNVQNQFYHHLRANFNAIKLAYIILEHLKTQLQYIKTKVAQNIILFEIIERTSFIYQT